MKSNTDQIYQEVLIGVELEKTDIRMMGLLESLSQAFGTDRFTFVHVMPKIDRTDPFAMVYDSNPWILDNEKKTEIAAVMKAKVERICKQEGDEIFEYFVAQGNILDELINLCNDQDADLMVLGRSKEDDHSIKAKNLIRQIDADLLIIPEESPNHMKKILVAIDFSENSLKALHQALLMKDRMGITEKLQVLNVYERPDIMASNLEMSVAKLEQQIALNHKEGFEKFVTNHLPDRKNEIEPILLQIDSPRAFKHILRQAKKSKADLIVLGSKGHSRLARLILGSTAERLLNINDSIPMLIVK